MNQRTLLQPPSIHVVVLNWNRRDDTLACLASLQQAATPRLSLILVDQGSADGSVEAVADRFPAVEIVQTGANLGFSGGINMGIRHALAAGAQQVLLLNNDTIVHPRMVERLAERCAADVGIVSPAVFHMDPPHRIWSTGGGIDPVLLEITGNHGRGEGLPPGPIAREFVTGCAMLISRRVFEEVGLFDERFFMYYEDMDFCLRVCAAGYRILLVPDALLWHRVSQSSGGANSPGERYHMARSSGLYFRKHMGGARIPLIVAYRGLSALRWSGRLAAARQWPSLVAYWRGLLAGWLPARAARRG